MTTKQTPTTAAVELLARSEDMFTGTGCPPKDESSADSEPSEHPDPRPSS